jgi:nitrogen fixation protein
MIGHLYRYPHPTEEGKFLYVGQGAKRDALHRRGASSFGRRFKRDFPNAELSQPVREELFVENQMDLNELETIWMFRFHTWCGYKDGMNLTFPGSLDYIAAGKIGGLLSGPVQGRKNAENGHLSRVANLPQTKEARKINAQNAIQSGQVKAMGLRYGHQNGLNSVASGHLKRISNLPQTIEARKKNGLIQGRRNADTGHMKSIQKIGASLGGKIGGAISGRKKAESGDWARIQQLPQSKEAQHKSGLALGRRNVESGFIQALGRKNAEIGRMNSHNRWHIARGRPNPSCVFCSEQNLVIAFA